MILNNSYKNNGFLFFKITNKTKIFINQINLIINNYKKKNRINFDFINDDDLSKHTLNLQNKINSTHGPKEFFELNKTLFKKLFKENQFSLQSYFYLRITKPKHKKLKYKPLDLHRETFQGPEFYDKLMNIWIPIKDCEKNNSIRYVQKSHKFKRFKDFDFVLRKTNIKKGSTENKIGLLYKDRKLKFFKNFRITRLFKKNHFMLFSGELIHGNAENMTNKTRFSIDLRFMLKKNMIYNPIQGSTKKKYFKILSI